MASPTRWTRVWVNSGSWWWIGRPGVLQFMGSQRVGHDWATDLIWSDELILLLMVSRMSLKAFYSFPLLFFTSLIGWLSLSYLWIHFLCLLVNSACCWTILWNFLVHLLKYLALWFQFANVYYFLSLCWKCSFVHSLLTWPQWAYLWIVKH